MVMLSTMATSIGRPSDEVVCMHGYVVGIVKNGGDNRRGKRKMGGKIVGREQSCSVGEL